MLTMIYSARGFFSFTLLAIFQLIVVLLNYCNGITTTHYNRPPEFSRIENKIEKVIFPNISIAERQKRLLPYINHYLSPSNEGEQPYQFEAPSKQPSQAKLNELIGIAYEPTAYGAPQQQNIKFTPFLPSNAVPGGFVPMATPPQQQKPSPQQQQQQQQQQPQQIEISYVPFEQTKKMPNYSVIYDKLSQLKLRQSALTRTQVPRYIYNRKPQVNYLTNFIPNTTPKTYVHTYNPTNIEVPQNYNIPADEISITENSLRVPQTDNPPQKIQELFYQPIQKPHQQEIIYKTIQKQPQVHEVLYQQPKGIYQTIQKPQNEIYQTIQKPQEEIYQTIQKQPQQIRELIYQPTQKQAQQEQEIIYHQIQKSRPVQEIYQTLQKQPQYVTIFAKNPQLNYVIQGRKQYPNQSTRQYLQEVIPTTTKPVVVIPQIQYATKRPTPKPLIIYQPTPSQTYTLQPLVTHNGQNYQPVTEIVPTTPVQTENPNSLSVILRKLQESNALPHTITPNNVDNSIKTLVNILNTLKAQSKAAAQPIVVPDEGDYEQEEINETDDEPINSKSNGITTQTFPSQAFEEGGTPGKPGVDYPALATIPPTSFNCTTQRYKGFFADPESRCQVWHYCDLNGGQASFLCPNGTIFSQVALTCDWWFNVKCSTTTQLYVLNERLYKYIIPLQPKFPEDYSGPLVDKYLTIKFKEMEDKLKEEKEKETDSDDDKTEEVDELQLLEDKNNESSTATSHKK